MNPLVAVGFIVVGIAVLAAAASARLGRTPQARSWVQGDTRDQGRALLLLPGAALGLIAAGMTAWSDTPWGGPILVLAAVGFVVLVLWAALQVRVPVWFLPGWSRQSVRARRKSERGKAR